MAGLQIMVTIQPGNRQEFLQALDMFCSQKATDNDGTDGHLFEAVDTPNRFFYLKQFIDRRLLENFLKTDPVQSTFGSHPGAGEANIHSTC